MKINTLFNIIIVFLASLRPKLVILFGTFLLVGVHGFGQTVTVSAINGNTTEAGGTADFTLVLDSEPTADVTIPLSSDNTDEGTVSPASVTFTPSNWNSAQTVTVTGVDDAIVDGDTNYNIITGDPTSVDLAYEALGDLDVDDIPVTNTDNDAVGVTVSTISGNTTELGGTADFTVVLDSEPTADVTIHLSISDTSEGNLAVTNVVFTAANWDIPQTVTVTGVDDAVVDGDVDYNIITGNVSSPDAFYNALTAVNVADVEVTNTDNDAAGVTVSTISGNTTESGGTATFTVVLDSEPTADVNIPLSSDNTDEGTLAVANVVFTAANWDTPQTVTVTGVDDAVVDGDVDYNIITGNVSSPDAFYNALTAANVADVEVTNTDNDTAGITVSAISGNTTEAGGTASFTVVLDSEPTANVTIPLSSDNTNEGTLAVVNVVFTAANWDTPQTVTVTGVDDAVVDGDVDYNIITGNVTSPDAFYNALTATNVANVEVTNTDNDAVGVTVSAISGNTTEAGGTATFTVVLDSEPTADVTIPLSSSDTSEGTLAVTNMVFTAGNWNLAQTVTVTGVDDAVVDGDVDYNIITGNVSSPDTSYNVLTAANVANVAVVNTDDDTAGVSIDDVTVNEDDDTATFTVTLNGFVLFGTTVSYTTADNTALAGSDYEAASGNFFFSGLINGDTQEITIDINEDNLVEGTETFSVNLTNATGFAQLAKAEGIGTITDNDSYVASITATDATATETGSATGQFTVDLGTINTTGSPIVVNFGVATGGSNATDTTDYANIGTSVSIEDGEQTGLITVTPVDDELVEGPETVVLTLATGTGYTVATAPNNTATVTIADNDSYVASITANEPTASETDSASGQFTVSLGAANATGGAIEVNYVISAGGSNATNTTDYATIGTSVSIANGDQTGQITVTPVDDDLAEGSESVILTLTSGIGYDVASAPNNTATVIIADNDNCMEAPLINDTPTIFCEDFSQDLDAYTDTAIPSGFELIWKSSSDFNSGAEYDIVSDPATYYGFLHNEGSGCTSPPLEVTLVRNEPPVVEESPTNLTICGPGMVTLSAAASGGGSLFWYDSESGGDSLEEGSSFSPNVNVTTTYYVEAFANGCFSERVPVTVTVAESPDAGITTNTVACSAVGEDSNSIDLDSTRSGGDSGVWSIVGTPPGSISIAAGNIVNFEGVPDGDYIFSFTTNTAVAPCPDESVEVTISVTSCTVDSDGDGILDQDEIALGLDPNDADTDGDGLDDLVEVGPDIDSPLDTDEDGIIDALDSNILDSDNDGVVDQLDPANTNPCIPAISEACQIDLALEKTVDKESVLVGREVVFTVTLTNLSQMMVTNIAVNDLVGPATGFQYVNSVATKGVYDAVAGVWQLDEVLAEEINTLTITAIVPEEGSYQNVAALVDSFPEDSNATNNTATATVTATPRSTDECGFLFNMISPNGDGVNDTVYINCIGDYPNNTLQVYDRYGNEVFAANGYDNTWTGTGNNGDLPKGTYFYILDLGDGTEVNKGWIQIIR